MNCYFGSYNDVGYDWLKCNPIREKSSTIILLIQTRRIISGVIVTYTLLFSSFENCYVSVTQHAACFVKINWDFAAKIQHNMMLVMSCCSIYRQFGILEIADR